MSQRQIAVILIIMVTKPFGVFFSNTIGIIGTIVFLLAYFFCIIWDNPEFTANLEKRYDKGNQNN